MTHDEKLAMEMIDALFASHENLNRDEIDNFNVRFHQILDQYRVSVDRYLDLYSVHLCGIG